MQLVRRTYKCTGCRRRMTVFDRPLTECVICGKPVELLKEGDPPVYAGVERPKQDAPSPTDYK